jgi:hypothetical protein
MRRGPSSSGVSVQGRGSRRLGDGREAVDTGRAPL